ncbi:MAG: gamma carbonic anhydrase family protein [Candidatus Thermoplasmatota archaeon]|nr:gamma carbonic anhydrase family protein [Candidatus Thermoplasmatota archaeon]
MTPQIHPSSYVDPTAVLIGAVTIGKKCGVFPHAVIRGDQNTIVIDEGSNVQDCCVIHTDVDHTVSIGKQVTIGHAAMIHGATIEDECLIGIHATVLNGAQIHEGSIIGACALVTENMVVPAHSLVLGIPGRIIKQDASFRSVARKNAEIYQALSAKHLQGEYARFSATSSTPSR